MLFPKLNDMLLFWLWGSNTCVVVFLFFFVDMRSNTDIFKETNLFIHTALSVS